ncbi:MAG: aldo/keto reductase [bacterium]
METYTLRSGAEIPALGLGTWQNKGQDCVNAVSKALEMGYRHIDTADIYDNHEYVGQGIKKAEINRDELFVTSKLFRHHLQYEQVLEKGKKILDELNLEYLDLLLIHWPVRSVPLEETLEAMHELQKEGLVRDIGVSNFTIRHLEEIKEKSEVPIANNQVEFHPYLYQKELLDYCQENGLVVTAYSPLARGEIFSDQDIIDLSQEFSRSPAQLVLKWLLDKDMVVIPKASTIEHIKENMQLFSWELPDKAREVLDGKNRDHRIIDPSFGDF